MKDNHPEAADSYSTNLEIHCYGTQNFTVITKAHH